MSELGKVLVVDDEPAILLAVADELRFEGWQVRTATDGDAAIEAALSWRPDIVLLDVMLPGRNGFSVCRQLRAQSPDFWIILLTARSQEGERVQGFEAGADDYVTKPFSLRELMARVRVGLRRRQRTPTPNTLHLAELTVDLAGRSVHRNGAELSLTRKEFDILALLLERPGEVVPRDLFCERVWGDVHVTDRVIDTHVFGLRRKIEPDPANPTLILSVRGVGYKLART
jgi:two-component system response regulator MtrA